MPLISWNIDELDTALVEFIQPVMDEFGQQVIAEALPPVDTGFLMNSAYITSSLNDSYDLTWETGRYRDQRGRLVSRFQTPRIEPNEPPGTIVGWAAEHAWEIEETQPFIYIALLSAAGQLEGEGNG